MENISQTINVYTKGVALSLIPSRVTSIDKISVPSRTYFVVVAVSVSLSNIYYVCQAIM